MDPENSDASDDDDFDNHLYFEKIPDDPKKSKRFQYTSSSIIAKTNLVRSSDFEASPSVIHFSGFIVGQEYTLQLNIINFSSHKKRMNVLPLNSKVFKVESIY
jgi:hypothetical protein